jgi:hypothetical protein
MSWATVALIASLVGPGLDTASTIQKIQQGCVEAAPLAQAIGATTPVRIAIYKSGVAVGLTWTFGTQATQHPKAVMAARWSVAAAGTAAAIHNWRVSCR